LLSIIFGLASALSWGAGDFTGGLAARKVGAYRSVFYAEVSSASSSFSLPQFFMDEPLPDVRALDLCTRWQASSAQWA
jgi:drug/metabolite transporter (DMT)-like permease